MTRYVKKYPVATYVICCLVPVHVILWSALATGASPESLQPLKLPFAILPSITAFVLTFISSGETGVAALAKQTFIRETPPWIYITGLLVFPLIGFAALGARYFYDGYFPVSGDWKPWWMIIGASPFLLIVPGIFEEYGWRGFMQQRLQKRVNVFAASMLVGITWGSWHMMDFLTGNWLFEPMTVGVFFFYITGVSILVGLFFNWSGGSVFVAMIVHFSSNLVNFFIPLWLLEPGVLTPLIFVGLIWVIVVILFLGWLFGSAQDAGTR